MSAATEYPPEALGNLKRMQEWAKAHAGGRIEPRARTREQHQTLIRYKWHCEDNGLDICHLLISHAQADMAAFDDEQVRALKKTAPFIVLNQQNNFISNVDRPRRLPDLGANGSSLTIRGLRSTTIRVCIEDHILLRALEMRRSFTCMDLPELRPNLFRKAILRLKRKGLIEPVSPRSCPRTYLLTPKLLMRFVSENTRVLHLASEGDPRVGVK